MITDAQTLLIAAAPASSLFASSTFGIDLNTDFGSGPTTVPAEQRRSPLLGMGEDIMLRVDVILAFAIGAGEPVAQFHAVLSNVGDGVTVHGGSDVISIGVQAPSLVNVGGTTFNGIATADLTTGSYFFIRFHPWTAGMGRNFADAVVLAKNLRYLGVMITVPNYTEGGAGTHAFSTGIITAHLVKAGDVLQDPTDFIYPAGSLPVG